MRSSQAAIRRRARRWIGGIAGAALLGSAVIVSPAIVSPAAADEADADLARFYGQTLTWGPCDDAAGGAQCGTVTVPMDYRNPTGRTLDLAVLRIPASGNARGSLLVNPGGPGAGGVDFAEYLSTVIDSDVRAVYDIVGFDPRGVGQSAPVTCLTDKQLLRWTRTDITPDTARERRTLFSRADRISQGCLDRDAALARSVGTENTVRDMDILRRVLGDDELNWFGFSYGTELGALYAQRFPDRVGRMVLDGAVDPSLNAMEVSEDQSAGFQRAIARFAADCAKRSNCIATTQAGVLSAINRLLVQLDRAPLPSDGSRRLVQAEALTALFFSMYSTDLWPTLRSGLSQALDGDGSTLQLLAQLANDQTGPNTFGSNITSAFYAIGCWDYPPTPGIKGLRQAASEWSANARVPEMAVAMSWGNAPCSTWFGHSDTPPAPVTSTTSAPILIIGTTYDPATPYAWSQALRAQLPTSRLLTHRGDGHTVYGGSNLCIDNFADTYLLTGDLPEPGTVCSS